MNVLKEGSVPVFAKGTKITLKNQLFSEEGLLLVEEGAPGVVTSILPEFTIELDSTGLVLHVDSISDVSNLLRISEYTPKFRIIKGD